jgi:hypothetical protein
MTQGPGVQVAADPPIRRVAGSRASSRPSQASRIVSPLSHQAVPNRLTVVAPGRSESSHHCHTRPSRIVSPLPHQTIPNRLTTATPDHPESSHRWGWATSRIVSRSRRASVTNRLTEAARLHWSCWSRRCAVGRRATPFGVWLATSGLPSSARALGPRRRPRPHETIRDRVADRCETIRNSPASQRVRRFVISSPRRNETIRNPPGSCG